MNVARIEELRELRAMWEAAPDGSDEKGLLGFRLMDEAFEALPHFLAAASRGDEGLREAARDAVAVLAEIDPPSGYRAKRWRVALDALRVALAAAEERA